MPKRYKIGYTEDLNTLVNYISTSPKYIFWKDILQFSVDYDLYIDLYMNLNLIKYLIDERNAQIVSEARKRKENKAD